jgi:hypothetical protein
VGTGGADHDSGRRGILSGPGGSTALAGHSGPPPLLACDPAARRLPPRLGQPGAPARRVDGVAALVRPADPLRRCGPGVVHRQPRTLPSRGRVAVREPGRDVGALRPFDHGRHGDGAAGAGRSPLYGPARARRAHTFRAPRAVVAGSARGSGCARCCGARAAPPRRAPGAVDRIPCAGGEAALVPARTGAARRIHADAGAALGRVRHRLPPPRPRPVR